MNRVEMRAVLAGGGTVLHNGKHIKSEADIPSEAELAVDNGTEADALNALQAQLARLQEEKESLERALAEKAEKSKKKVEVTAVKTDEKEKETKK